MFTSCQFWGWEWADVVWCTAVDAEMAGTRRGRGSHPRPGHRSTGRCPVVNRGGAAAAATGAQCFWLLQPGQRHAGQAGAVHHHATICGRTWRRSRRSPTPIRAPTAIRRATPASPATRRRSTTSPTLMRKAGYDVTLQPYTFTYSSYVGTPTLSEVSPTAAASRWSTTGTRAPARATRPRDLKPAGRTVMPPTPTPSSASGCTPSDFTGLSPARSR